MSDLLGFQIQLKVAPVWVTAAAEIAALAAEIGEMTHDRDIERVDAWVEGQPAPVAVHSERIKRLTIKIPLSLHQKVKVKRVGEGTSKADWVRRLGSVLSSEAVLARNPLGFLFPDESFKSLD